jgi:hypothetical protein
MITSVKPEHVWLGLNSRPASVHLPEPSAEKLVALEKRLTAAGIPVKWKTKPAERGLVRAGSAES